MVVAVAVACGVDVVPGVGVVVGVGVAVADADDGLGVGVAVPDLGVGVGVAVPDTGVDASPVAIAVVLGVNVTWLVGLAPDVAVALAANKFCSNDGSNVDVLLLTATDVQPVRSSARAVKHNRRFKIYHLVSRY